MLQVPVVDFSPFLADEGMNVGAEPTEAQMGVAKQLGSACRDHGFICLKDCGGQELADAVAEAFSASKQLFALSDEEKANLHQHHPEHNTGFSAFAKERLNHKRGWDMKETFALHKSSFTEDGFFRGCPEGFEQASQRIWQALEAAARRYCRQCSLALNLEDDYFSKHFEKWDMVTLRFLHYPPVEYEGPLDSSQAIRTGEHTDYGMFTFLFIEKAGSVESRGLQAKPVQGGRAGDSSGSGNGWVDVECTEGCVVNTGALLARWTNDVWRATAHRVIVPNSEVASGHRYSIACFFDPDADSVISVDPRFGEPKYKPITSYDYLMMRIREAFAGTAPETEN
mmetsp:Transcript_71640/g.133929  ORF Transcript_71640/g.133929 Transcript_71640/m.133929 type:complete len:340 (-) Transcript_71640:121-1140(-)